MRTIPLSDDGILSACQSGRSTKRAIDPGDWRWATKIRRNCNIFFASRGMPVDTQADIQARAYAATARRAA